MATGLCACVDRPQAEEPEDAVAVVGHFGRRSMDRRLIHLAVVKVFDLLGDGEWRLATS